MSYLEFQRHGKQSLPEDLHRETAWEIRNHCLEVELILAGFIAEPAGEPEALILKLSGERVSRCDSFAAIGSGAFLAEASLMQRNYIAIAGVPYATYLAYEAKRLGERAPGVGKETGIVALVHHQQHGVVLNFFVPEKIPLLEKEFRRFGPQRLTASKLKPLPQDAWFRATEPDQESTTADPSPPPPSRE